MQESAAFLEIKDEEIESLKTKYPGALMILYKIIKKMKSYTLAELDLPEKIT